MTPSITEAQINAALGSLLSAMLPQLGNQIVVGQINRVPTYEGDYIVFWPLRRPRLGTDDENAIDAVFTATITPIDGNTATLDITAVNPNFSGQLEVGSTIFGVNVADNTIITALETGSGGLGTYIVTPSQTVGSETIAAGVINYDQSTELVYQCDIHGPNSGDNAQVVSTLFRSSFAVNQMNGTGISPLYHDHPRQVPFSTAANQWEERWSIDLHLQAIPIISVPQEFASTADVNVIDVEATYG